MREIKTAGSPGTAPRKLTEAEFRDREFSTAIVLFHEAVASRLAISSTEWKCLGLLDQHGPLTAGRLAELSGFTTGAITGIVDRLERAGYARRERHPTDRRGVIVHPARLGEVKERIAPIFGSLGRAMKIVTQRYSKTELAVIADYLDRVTAVLHEQTTRLNAARAIQPLRRLSK